MIKVEPASDEAIIEAVRKSERSIGHSPIKWATLKAIRRLLPNEPNLELRLRQLAAKGVLNMKLGWQNYAAKGILPPHNFRVGYRPNQPRFRVL